jgi:hypothetical protein
MLRIALILAFLLPAIGGPLTSVWESTGASIDPWGNPDGQSAPPSIDSGLGIDPWG